MSKFKTIGVLAVAVAALAVIGSAVAETGGSTAFTTGYGSATATVYAKKYWGDNGYYIQVTARADSEGSKCTYVEAEVVVSWNFNPDGRVVRDCGGTPNGGSWDVHIPSIGGTPGYVEIKYCYEKAWAIDPCEVSVVDV